MKKIYYVLVFILIVLFAVGCKEGKEINVKLEPINIDADNILESNNKDFDDVKELITLYLRENRNINGDIKSKIDIQEIAVDLINEGQQLQLYEVVLDYAWLHGIAVLKDNQVMGILSGMSKDGLFLADLDDDNSYEIIYNTTIGSGMIRNVIEVMSIKDGEIYNIQLYEDNKGIAIKANKLDYRLYIHWNYLDLDRVVEEPIGYLMLKDDKLIIKEVD